MRPVACSEAQAALGREIEWLPEPPRAPIARVIGREVTALASALAIWAALYVPVVALASTWGLTLLPLYLPAPVAAFAYVLLIDPRSRDQAIKRAILLVALGWAVTNPLLIPGNPVFNEILKASLFFHPVPMIGEDPLFGVWMYSFLSFWVIGIAYCGYLGYWAGRLADRLLEKKARTGTLL